MRDPAFLERMKTLGLEVNPMTGRDLQAEIERTMGGADQVARDIKRLLEL
jgi:tripartite-type tricarboxylate transporter receptor subunit TctC